MSDPSLASVNPPAPEACPPPLAWQEVLQGVEQQGAPFHYSSGGIELDGVSIGEGPPIWFLNGFAGDRQLYSLLAWLLRDRFRCLLVDENWSEGLAHASLQGLLAQAFNAAFRDLDTPRPALFGTSFGAQTALTIANSLRNSSAPIRAAILHEGFFRRRPSLTERMLAWGASHSGKRLADFPSWVQIQEANHRRWFPPIDPSRWNFLLDNLGDTPTQRWATLARAAAATNTLESQCSEITTPVLLLRTEGDGPVATAATNELMVRLPNAQEETLHTSGHFAFLTHPHRVAKLITGFLANVP
ncbi:MAG TPA: alpha/beta hydrolase [Caulifigura sp.]|nr:alpha/beta hydrolase [Caulifigura sp.]